MPQTKLAISVIPCFCFSLLCNANNFNTLIETSLLVNLDSSLVEPNRRYSNSYQPFGQENLITDKMDLALTSPNPDLSSSIEEILNTLDENSLFDAFDHVLSYSIDLKNNGSYGNAEVSSQVVKNNLKIAVDACIKRSEALNINERTIAENISSRTIENFIVNQKAIYNWSDSTPEWLEILAEIITTSFLNAFQETDQQSILPVFIEAFTDSVLNLYNLDIGNPNYRSTHLYPGVESVSNDPSLANEIMLFGGDTEGYYKFDPLKSKVFASSTSGLIKAASKQAIISSNIDFASSEKLFSDAVDGITESYFNFVNSLDGDHTLFTYELTKSFALGATKAALDTVLEYEDTSENISADSFLEFISEQIGSKVMLRALNSPNLSINELAESSAIGNALGTQFSAIYHNEHTLDPRFAGFKRDTFAKQSSMGMSRGTLKTISSNIEQFVTIVNITPDNLVSEIASHTAKGSLYGNTTLAIYNPTPKELLSIINNSARGAAEGSTNVLELNNVDKSQEATEDVVVQVARASAHGSALATSFGMAVLNDAKPDILTYDRKTIVAIESASYGSAFGAITGAIKNGVPDTIVIKQASMQGSTEGALIGAGLGTGYDDEFYNLEGNSYLDAELNSKKNIIKAVAESSSNASASAGESRATKTIRSNSKNMIMLMRKFNISPSTTNPSRIFKKRQSEDTNFDSEFPINDKFRAASPI